MKHQLKLLMKHASLATIILLFSCFDASAVLVMHEWQKDHRGYSIELIPGTGVSGVPARYVAAGTVYEPGFSNVAWHWMHLDANGYVIMERTTWPSIPGQMEFRVVDIACNNHFEFWVTIQVRDFSGFDYIYVAGIDIVAGDLPAPRNAIAIKSINTTHRNLYPTHTFYADDALYICGYAAEGTEYPNQPNAHYSDKWGMMLKCDVNAATPATTQYFWNTPGVGNQDFDMALKIAPNNYGTTFPLLVTGAVNINDEWVSGVLAAKVDKNGFPSTLKGLEPLAHYYTPVPNRPVGVYGVDIRGGVRGGIDPQPGDGMDYDNVILVNYFDEQEEQARTYGIIRTRNDFTTYNWAINSYKYMNDEQIAWGKQFTEMHGYEGQNGQNPCWQIDNHIKVVGEQFDAYSICPLTLPWDAVPLSVTNINPFLRTIYLGMTHWSYTTGFMPFQEQNPLLYLSSLGTTSSSMDYLQGSLGASALLEDITRLHTFTSIQRFYDDPTVSNPPQPDPAMLLPIGSTATAWLSTKFLGLQGSSRSETSCGKEVSSCAPMGYSGVLNTSEFTRPGSVDVLTNPAYWYFSILPYQGQIPPFYDCSEGRYKTTAIAEIDNGNSINIYPNPATNELNIRLGQSNGTYQVTLTDMAGRVVLTNKGDMTSNTIKLQLPQLSTGVYVVNVITDETTYTEKVTIE